MIIHPAQSESDREAVASLFADYARSLPVDLGYQDFAAELAALPGKYAPPKGELLLARDESGAAVACAGLRPLDVPGCCELKRLYVRPEGRGTGLGRRMTDAIIIRAREIGYSELRLDTLPTMAAAIAMYRDIGFRAIDPYYGPVPSGTVFLSLDL